MGHLIFHVEHSTLKAELGAGLPGEEDALLGGGKVERGAFAIGQKGESALALRRAYEDCQLAAGGNQAGGSDQRVIEAFDSAQGDQAGTLGERFGTDIEDGKAGEMERATDFAEKGRLFAAAFDEGELQTGSPILQGQAGKAGSAAEIEDLLLGIAGKERAGGEERLAEMTNDHLLWRTEGSEVHALVPAREQVEVDADRGQQSVIEFGGGDKGREQVAQG